MNGQQTVYKETFVHVDNNLAICRRTQPFAGVSQIGALENFGNVFFIEELWATTSEYIL